MSCAFTIGSVSYQMSFEFENNPVSSGLKSLITLHKLETLSFFFLEKALIENHVFVVFKKGSSLAKLKSKYSTTKATSLRSLKGISYWSLYLKNRVCSMVLVQLVFLWRLLFQCCLSFNFQVLVISQPSEPGLAGLVCNLWSQGCYR